MELISFALGLSQTQARQKAHVRAAQLALGRLSWAHFAESCVTCVSVCRGEKAMQQKQFI